MSSRKYGVGIVGLTPGRSWAAIAHLPALRALSDDYAVIGVANSSRESAEEAAQACGVARAFADVSELVSSPDVEVVAITVKVPYHRELVRAAVEAGKHVYCEWPLGNGLTEARELAQLVREKGVLGVVGTQARVSPAVEYVRDLVADGYVGELLSSTVVGDGGSWGAETPEVYAYLLERANGATMLTIPLGHTLAAITEVLGSVADVAATLTTRRKSVRIIETGEQKPMTAADQILVSGTFKSGAPLSIHYRGGKSRGTGFLWEINGTRGDLQVTGALGHSQMVELTVKGGNGDATTMEALKIPEKYGADPVDGTIPGNVRRVYQRMASDLANGTHLAPSFDDAVANHQLIAAIEAAAANGGRVRPVTL